MRVRARTVLILSLLAGLALTSIARADDPLQWTPPAQPPLLRERLPKPGFARRLAEAQKDLETDPFDPHMPAVGAQVIYVAPDSPAQQLGIAAGDVFIKTGDKPVINTADWTAARAAGGNTFTVWTPGSAANAAERKVTLPPGLIEVQLQDWLRPDVIYYRSLPDGVKPDPLMLVATRATPSDPALAETALAHAQKAGGDKPIISVLAAAIAVNAGEFDDGLAFANHAMKDCSEDDKPILASLMHTAALGSFRLKFAMDLEKQYPFLKPTGTNYPAGILESTVKKLDGVSLPSSSPADEFAKLTTQDMAKQIKGAAMGEEKTNGVSGIAAEDIRRGDKTNFKAPSDTYLLYVLGPTGHNAQFSARCHFTDTDTNKSGFTKAVTLGIAPRELKGQLLEIVIASTGRITVQGPWNPPCSFQANFPPSRGFDVTMTVVGQRCEIDINKTRVFYGPFLLPTERRALRLSIQGCGITGEVKNVVWKIDRSGK